MALAEVVTSILGGGVTGLLGTCFTSFVNFKMEQQKNEHELKMIDAETKAMVAEAEANIKITETKTAGEIKIAEMDAFVASMGHGNKDLLKTSYVNKLVDSQSRVPRFIGTMIVFLLAMVDFLRGLARPLITYYLLFLATWITIALHSFIKGMEQAPGPDGMVALYNNVILAMLYLTVTVISWWFGDRRVGKFFEANNKR